MSKSPKKSSSKATSSGLFSFLYNDEFTALVEGHPLRKYFLWAVLFTTAFYAAGSAFIAFQSRPDSPRDGATVLDTPLTQVPFIRNAGMGWSKSLADSEKEFVSTFFAFASVSVLLLICDLAFVSNKIGVIPAVGVIVGVGQYVALVYKVLANDPNFDNFADLQDNQSTAIEWIYKISFGIAVQAIIASLISIPDVSDDHAIVQKFGYLSCVASFLVYFYGMYLTIGSQGAVLPAGVGVSKLTSTLQFLQAGVILALPSLNAIAAA